METSQPFALAKIGQIAIPIRDVARAVAFYQNKLGMEYLFTASSLAFFNCGGVRLMLSMPEPGEQEHSSSVIYFTVEDIEKAYGEMLGRGVAFVDRPHLIASLDTHDLWMAFFRDSEQNMLAIMSEVQHVS